ncbi:hypothetical protein [Georgenia sunbinii]|uniref:hypothetical protein n=1 Tax=Georgenia sunbinii TaxID=3117728 RepID=UPI002F267BC9
MGRLTTCRAVLAATAVAVTLLAGCGDGAEEPTDPGTTAPPTTQAPSPGGTATPSPGGTATSPPGGTEAPTAPGGGPSADSPEVVAAVADLAEHLGIAPDDVSVVSLESVTWPDGSLGCPQPGMSYTQALVPGTRLVLGAEGAEYAYHAGSEPDLTRCDRPQQPAPTG